MYLTLYKAAKDGKIHYYILHDRQASIITPYALTVVWRSGQGRGRERFYPFERLSEMDVMVRRLLKKKMRECYSLLYSFSRDARWTEAATEAVNEATEEQRGSRRKKA